MKQNSKKWILGLAGASALAVLLGAGILRQRAAACYSTSSFAMSTVITQQVYGPHGEEAAGQVTQALAQFEDRLSVFEGESEISRINAAAGKEPVAVSEETFALIRRSLDLSAQSEGAFQITIAPLTQLWGITTDHPRVPTQQEIDAVLPLVDDASVVLDEAAGTVFLPQEGQAIDLGGIAKGNACTLAAEIYEEQGVRSAILNIGGNVYVKGRSPEGDRFRIGFRTPERGSQSYIASVALEDQVMAVSGGYERYFETADGTRYHHILSPETGYPAQSDILSVGVVSSDGTQADFLSTTLFVWGDARTREFMEEHPEIGVIFLNESGELVVSKMLEESFRLSEEGEGYSVVFL